MQALRAMQVALTPERKRQKVDDAALESEDDAKDQALMTADDDDEEPLPDWAKGQEERMLLKFQGMMQEIQKDLNCVKMEMEHVKLQAEVAQWLYQGQMRPWKKLQRRRRKSQTSRKAFWTSP